MTMKCMSNAGTKRDRINKEVAELEAIRDGISLQIDQAQAALNSARGQLDALANFAARHKKEADWP